MIQDVEKTMPSEDILLAWLAGIVDGEGSIGIYKNRIRPKSIGQFNLTIVNTDKDILNKVESILKKLNIFYSRYIHDPEGSKKFKNPKVCEAITIRRREDFKKTLVILAPLLVGVKKSRAENALLILKNNPRKIKPIYRCDFCKKKFSGRKRKYCSLKCWHDFSTGKNNPNFRHGKYITCND